MPFVAGTSNVPPNSLAEGERRMKKARRSVTKQAATNGATTRKRKKSNTESAIRTGHHTQDTRESLSNTVVKKQKRGEAKRDFVTLVEATGVRESTNDLDELSIGGPLLTSTPKLVNGVITNSYRQTHGDSLISATPKAAVLLASPSPGVRSITSATFPSAQDAVLTDSFTEKYIIPASNHGIAPVEDITKSSHKISRKYKSPRRNRVLQEDNHADIYNFPDEHVIPDTQPVLASQGEEIQVVAEPNSATKKYKKDHERKRNIAVVPESQDDDEGNGLEDLAKNTSLLIRNGALDNAQENLMTISDTQLSNLPSVVEKEARLTNSKKKHTRPKGSVNEVPETQNSIQKPPNPRANSDAEELEREKETSYASVNGHRDTSHDEDQDEPIEEQEVEGAAEDFAMVDLDLERDVAKIRHVAKRLCKVQSINEQAFLKLVHSEFGSDLDTFYRALRKHFRDRKDEAYIRSLVKSLFPKPGETKLTKASKRSTTVALERKKRPPMLLGRSQGNGLVPEATHSSAAAELLYKEHALTHPEYRIGALSMEEAQMIDNAVRDYCEFNQITQEDFAQRLWDRELHQGHKRVIMANFIYLIHNRKSHNIYNYMRRRYNIFEQRCVFTPEDDAELGRLVEQKGRDWSEIGKIMGRFSEDCRDRYRNHLKVENRHLGEWTDAEHSEFMQYILELGPGVKPDYGVLAEKMGCRTRAQCRDHYFQLDPVDLSRKGRRQLKTTKSPQYIQTKQKENGAKRPRTPPKFMTGDIYDLFVGFQKLDVAGIEDVAWDSPLSLFSKKWTKEDYLKEFTKMQKSVKGWRSKTFGDIVEAVLSELRELPSDLLETRNTESFEGSQHNSSDNEEDDEERDGIADDDQERSRISGGKSHSSNNRGRAVSEEL